MISCTHGVDVLYANSHQLAERCTMGKLKKNKLKDKSNLTFFQPSLGTIEAAGEYEIKSDEPDAQPIPLEELSKRKPSSWVMINIRNNLFDGHEQKQNQNQMQKQENANENVANSGCMAYLKKIFNC